MATIASGGAVFLYGPLSASRVGAGASSAGFQVAADGVLYRDQSTTLPPTWVATADGWLRSGTASDYDVRFTKTLGDVANMSGSVTSGTWYNLSSDRHVGYSAGIGTALTGTFTIDIALASDHASIIATATATITAEGT